MCLGAHVHIQETLMCTYMCILMYNYVYLPIYLSIYRSIHPSIHPSIYLQIASFLGVLGLKRNSWTHLGNYVPPSQINNATTTECAKLIDFPLRTIIKCYTINCYITTKVTLSFITPLQSLTHIRSISQYQPLVSPIYKPSFMWQTSGKLT